MSCNSVCGLFGLSFVWFFLKPNHHAVIRRLVIYSEKLGFHKSIFLYPAFSKITFESKQKKYLVLKDALPRAVYACVFCITLCLGNTYVGPCGNQLITFKTKCNVKNACLNRVWQLGFKDASTSPFQAKKNPLTVLLFFCIMFICVYFYE